MTNRIRKIADNSASYFHYFPPAPDLATWGLCVTAAGYTKVPPRSPYPPARDHPADHSLNWDRGRVLDALQIILVLEGRGRFETKITGQLPINRQPTAFVLMPGVWHRYEPLRGTGWIESWVEVRGPLVDRLIRERVFDPADPLKEGVIESGLDQALDALHQLCRHGPLTPHLKRTAAAFAVLTAWRQSGGQHPARDRLTRALDEAELHLTSNFTQQIELEQLAKRVGMAYSYFRAAFQARTGLPPWKYVVALRMARARRILAGTDTKLEIIAAELGFSSAFHFSDAFKKSFGISPHKWREQLQKKNPPA